MLLSLLGLFLGCPSPEPQEPTDTQDPPTVIPPVPWQPTVVEVGSASANPEPISDLPTRGAAPIEPAEVLAIQGDEVQLYDALGAPELLAYDVAPLLAATWWEESLLLATEAGLVSWNNGLVPTELDSMVSGVTDLITLRSGLWMDTPNGLFVLRSGELLAVTVDGAPAQRFARGSASLVPVIWTTAGDQVVAMNFTDAGLTPFESFTMFGPVQDVAATRTGRAFALVEGWLVERQSNTEWTRLDLGEPVRELRGRRGADSIWARTDTAWIHIGASFEATDVPLDVDVTEDRFGRLLTSGDTGVVRYAVGYPLLLLDLPTENIVTAARIRVIPSSPALDPTLSLTATSVTGDTVDLPVEDYLVTLDPDVLSAGPWTLDAQAEYADETATASATVVIGADFVPTWPDHIQPIYETQCTPCHDGSLDILVLETEPAWRTYLHEGSTPGSPGILERINTDNMPSDTRVLSATEKFLVAEWAAAVTP